MTNRMLYHTVRVLVKVRNMCERIADSVMQKADVWIYCSLYNQTVADTSTLQWTEVSYLLLPLMMMSSLGCGLLTGVIVVRLRSVNC